MKKLFYALLISVLLVSCATEKKQTETTTEVVILSVNDMHGHIDQMPKLAYIADSLRNLYPQLVVVSAGDNRTGYAFSDKYPGAPTFPMINMMNEVGFDVTALGNHEFDGNVSGIEYFVKTAHFPMICGNVSFTGYPDFDLPDYTTITRNINGKDVKIIMVGMIETSNDGHPSSHPKNLLGVEFVDAQDKINDYLYLKDSCDIFVLLSHCGKDKELEFATKFPQFDLVIGGHSHSLCTEQLSDGVLYTQSEKYLDYTTVTKIKMENGKIVEKEAQVIDLQKVKNVDKNIKEEFDYYYSRKEFHDTVGYATTAFKNKIELGAFMAEAQRYLMKADSAMQNPGGVRLDSLKKGAIEVADIYNLDPFDNSLVIVEMTGKQVEDYLNVASTKDKNCTHVSGITYNIDYVREKNEDNNHFENAKAFVDGKPINPKKVYKVALNSYIANWAKGNCVSITETEQSANTAEFKYLENRQHLDYQNVRRACCTVVK